MTGFFGVVDNNGLSPGGNITGNTLPQFQTKLFHGLDFNIKGHGNFKLIVFQEQKGTGFHIHDLADHVHRIF